MRKNVRGAISPAGSLRDGRLAANEEAERSGRKPGKLLRTRKTLSNHGFVVMKRENHHVRPIAKTIGFRIVA